VSAPADAGVDAAVDAYRRALDLVASDAERRYLTRRLAEVEAATPARPQ
jgi:predicted RNA polymerase sigma factor